LLGPLLLCQQLPVVQELVLSPRLPLLVVQALLLLRSQQQLLLLLLLLLLPLAVSKALLVLDGHRHYATAGLGVTQPTASPRCNAVWGALCCCGVCRSHGACY
jgi:hypothetical protein